MKCKNCGKELIAGERYCRGCGTEIENVRMCINRDPELYELLKNDREPKPAARRAKRIGTKIIIIAAAAAVIASAVIAIIAVGSHEKNDKNDNNIEATQTPNATEEAVPVIADVATPVPTAAPTPEPTEMPAQRRGTAEPIPQEVRDQMYGLSYKPNNTISLDDLSYLTIPYYDFNYEIQYGHLVVNASLAEEVLDIFAELFDIKYPIERMELVDKYGADDYESIEYNNTSAFSPPAARAICQNTRWDGQ